MLPSCSLWFLHIGYSIAVALRPVSRTRLKIGGYRALPTWYLEAKVVSDISRSGERVDGAVAGARKRHRSSRPKNLQD